MPNPEDRRHAGVQSVTLSDFDADGDPGTMTVHTKLRDLDPERSWWHLYIIDGEGGTAEVVLKQGNPKPADLTLDAVLKLAGIADGALSGLAHDLGLSSEVIHLATFSHEPTEGDVAIVIEAWRKGIR